MCFSASTPMACAVPVRRCILECAAPFLRAAPGGTQGSTEECDLDGSLVFLCIHPLAFAGGRSQERARRDSVQERDQALRSIAQVLGTPPLPRFAAVPPVLDEGQCASQVPTPFGRGASRGSPHSLSPPFPQNGGCVQPGIFQQQGKRIWKDPCEGCAQKG